ncbi:MAG TPA: hypothetical protein VE954_35600 [Oligoflexus sp.]|uniref:hypothetical protein n=1 Tax=Oligoflexus sp. TaxID=1971216 RepID=UPI002D234EBF|nr:hypothetical protein [Oligoflexus sp.]HYX38459.1 hypothetical protein [Oligoflexus sp.]
MPLRGTEEALAKTLQASMKTAKSYDEAWQKFAEIVIAHIAENAIAIGTAPSGGGPIVDGKIQ